MSSSDSEDDCYGNIAQKLQSIKNTYVKESVRSTVSNDIPRSSPTVSIAEEVQPVIVEEDLNSTLNSTDNDEYTLDAIIANNSKAKPKRGRGGKRKATNDTCGPSKRTTRTSARASRSASQSTSNSNEGSSNSVTDTAAPELFTIPEPQNAPSTTRGRGRSARGRSTRQRGRGASPRGRGRRRRDDIREIFDALFNRRTLYDTNDYPVYSVGNTDEYPDQCDNQQLFSSNVKPSSNDVEIVDTDPLEDDNEEMSVKVYWQSLEIYKFNIRKYQKLTQIFNYFTEKEGVSIDKLLFTYNDRILKVDDTPDCINYSIAKFIDGGIVNQDVRHLFKENSENECTGFKIKFQCQNKKKPFETSLDPHEKLISAMIKCAEFLETPLDKLKFYFDGDLISSKNTPQDLELEGGECIDVKICS